MPLLLLLTAPVSNAGINTTMRLTIPTGALTELFDPSGTPDWKYSFHCFSLGGTDGQPTYVHGTAQTYWYFEGPIDQNRVLTAQLYAVNTFTGSPIRATLTLQYSLDELRYCYESPCE